MVSKKLPPIIGLLLLTSIVLTDSAEDSDSEDEESLEEINEEMMRKGKAWITGNITFPETLFHTSAVRIGSFNMKKFGASKAKKENVLKTIAKIVSRYDLIALQEITDVKGRAIKTLIATVNNESPHPYQYIVSPRVGRSKQKEQYGIFYRPDIFQVKNYLVFNDSQGDPFSREPLIAEAIIKQNGEKIGLINIHVAPKDAPKEIDALVDVHSWTGRRMRLRNIVILGDLNAGCDYIRKKDIPNIRLWHDKRYTWLIPDHFDTTVGKTHCSYDRIIVSGPYLSRNVKPDSGQVFEFDREFNMEMESALGISDHYPVEFTLLVKSPVANDDDEYNPEVLSSKSGYKAGGFSLESVLLAVYFSAIGLLNQF